MTAESRNKREGRYGGSWKGKHYRSDHCLRYQKGYEDWLKTPDGIEWKINWDKITLEELGELG